MKNRKKLPGIALCVLALASCSREIPDAKREDLFSLNLGVMEDELDLFERAGASFPAGVSIDMVHGVFYVGNAAGRKLMKFSGYGDILRLIYNPSGNPPFLGADAGDKRLSTYPFNALGHIAVDSAGNIYAEDGVARSSLPQARESAALFNRHVVRFDSTGAVTGFLGREGEGGSPLPVITGLFITEEDEPIVVCRNMDDWEVYVYTKTGALKKKVAPFSDKSIKLPPLPDNYYIESVTPDRKNPLLFYTVGSADVTGNKTGTEAKLYVYDMDAGDFVAALEPPLIDGAAYEFLGTDKHGFLYFMSPFLDNRGYRLQVLELSGKPVADVELPYSNSKTTLFRALSLSADGIVSGLFCHERGADMVWWRVDRKIDAIIKPSVQQKIAESPAPTTEGADAKEEIPEDKEVTIKAPR